MKRFEELVNEISTERICSTVIVFLALAPTTALAADDAYRREIEQNRRQTDEFLHSEKSPLLRIGRYEIKEGSRTLGSDPASTVVRSPGAPHGSV